MDVFDGIKRKFSNLVGVRATKQHGASQSSRTYHHHNGIVASYTYIDLGDNRFITAINYCISTEQIGNMDVSLHPAFYGCSGYHHKDALCSAAEDNLQHGGEVQRQLAVARRSAIATSKRRHFTNIRQKVDNLFSVNVVSRARPGQIVGYNSVVNRRRKFLEILIQSTRVNRNVEDVTAQRFVFNVFRSTLGSKTKAKVIRLLFAGRGSSGNPPIVDTDLRITRHVGSRPAFSCRCDVRCWINDGGRDGPAGGDR